MAINENDLSLIEQYIRKELQGDKKKEFENRVLKDEDFRNAYALEKSIHDSIIKMDKKNLKNTFDSIENKLEDEGFFNNKKRKGRGWIPLAVAASVAVLLVSVIYFQPDGANDQELLGEVKAKEVFENSFKLEASKIDSRLDELSMLGFAGEGEDEDKKKSTKAFLEQIEKSNWVGALSSINAHLVAFPADDEAMYYRAYIYFQQGEYTKAVKGFDEVRRITKSVKQKDAEYYFALIVVRAGKGEQDLAMDILKRISQDKLSDYQAIAKYIFESESQ